MKKKFLILISIAAACVMIASAAGYIFYFRKEPVCIAVAAPLGNPRGDQMLKGIQLYVDKINRKGGINGRHIKLLIYNDNDNSELAEQIAQRIADENKALIVLGHYWGYPSLAAGRIYKRNEIPAITASTTIDAVTRGNEWYFRTIPGDDLQGSFIANYMNRSLKKQTVSILYSKDLSESSLVENYEKTASAIGMDIFNRWELDFEDQHADKKIAEIIDVLKTTVKPDMLFLSMNAKNGARLIVSLKDAGIDIPIFGDYSLGRSLIFEIQQYPNEKAAPGHYTDGVYFASQFIKEIGNPKTFTATREFYNAYEEDMSSTAACYYDACMAAVEAIKKADIKGIKHIREDRRKIRNMLESFYDEKNGIKGVTGNIYFDEQRGTRRAYAVGVFHNQKMIPAFFQYRQYFRIEQGETLLKKILNGEIMVVDSVLMKSIHLIFTGIRRIQVTHADLKANTVELDFEIRFRYSGGFDVNQIIFENGMSPFQIETIRTETINGITTADYHVRGLFHTNFEFRRYPFESQIIQFRFRHSFQPMNELIFVPDGNQSVTEFADNADNEWKISRAAFFPDVIAKQTSLGTPAYFKSKFSLEFSRFAADIHVRKKFEPAGLILILLSTGLFFVLYRLFVMPPDSVLRGVKTIMAAFIINTAFYLKWMSDFHAAYFTVSDAVFFSAYVLLATGSALFFIRFRRFTQNQFLGFDSKTSESDGR